MSKPALWITRRASPTKAANSAATRGEDRLVGEEGGAQAVHVDGVLRHVALGIDVGVEGAPRRHVVDELDRADLDDPVAGVRIETGGFGVEDDLTHAFAPL